MRAFKTNKKVEKLTRYEKIKVLIKNCLLSNTTFLSLMLQLIMSIIAAIDISLSWTVSFQLLLFAFINESLSNIFASLRLKLSQLIMTLIFMIILQLIYSLFLFEIFQADYLLEEDDSKTLLCTSPTHCFISTFDYGVRFGGGVGDAMNHFDWEAPEFWTRFWISFSFFFIIVIIMLNLTSGIIIDTFSDLRAKTEEIKEDKKNVCLVCHRSHLEILKEGISFEEHVTKKHNVFYYMFYIDLIMSKDPNRMDEIDGYVHDNLISQNVQWIPKSDEQAKKEEEDTSSAEKDSITDVFEKALLQNGQTLEEIDDEIFQDDVPMPENSVKLLNETGIDKVIEICNFTTGVKLNTNEYWSIDIRQEKFE